jgi:hypothetical protein
LRGKEEFISVEWDEVAFEPTPFEDAPIKKGMCECKT